MSGVFIKSFNKDSDLSYDKPGYCIKLPTLDLMIKSKFTTEMLSILKQFTSVPDEHFFALYRQLIVNFAIAFRILPKAPGKGLGSHFVSTIYGAVYTLKLFVETYPKSDALLRYAVFSAAMLKFSSRPSKHFYVTINAADGEFIQALNLFQQGFGSEDDTFMKIFPLQSPYTHNHAILNGMLITQVMPQHGLDWLIAHPSLFEDWLTEIQNEDYGEGKLGLALKHIDFLENEFDNILLDVPMELVETPDTQMAEEFLNWLIEGIKDGSIQYNGQDPHGSHIHVLDYGIFIQNHPYLINTFNITYNGPVAYPVAARFGNPMGIVPWSGQDTRHAAQFGIKKTMMSAAKRQSGMMVDLKLKKLPKSAMADSLVTAKASLPDVSASKQNVAAAHKSKK